MVSIYPDVVSHELASEISQDININSADLLSELI